MRDPVYGPQIVGFPYNKDPNEVFLISEPPTWLDAYQLLRALKGSDKRGYDNGDVKIFDLPHSQHEPRCSEALTRMRFRV